MRPSASCGTYGGYEAHHRRGEKACSECLAAAATYQREYRQNNPAAAQNNRDRVTLYNKAEAELRRRHLAEFRAIFADLSRKESA